MNELVLKLAEQADRGFTGMSKDKYLRNAIVGSEAVNKFAMLVVEECLEECWYDATPRQIANNIRKKFGINEMLN
jgi:hypothetical protein